MELEWQVALSKKKKVLPIFTRKEKIPALLAPFLGIRFNKEDLNGTIDEDLFFNLFHLFVR